MDKDRNKKMDGIKDEQQINYENKQTKLRNPLKTAAEFLLAKPERIDIASELPGGKSISSRKTKKEKDEQNSEEWEVDEEIANIFEGLGTDNDDKSDKEGDKN